MIKQFLVIILLFVLKMGFSQELKKEYYQIVKTFIDCIKNDKIDNLKKNIIYPLKRKYPLSDIKNDSEFIRRYNEVFDNNLKKMIIKSDIKKDWSEVGWRGIMLNDGILWLDYEGRLIAVNYQSKFEKEKIKKVIEHEKRLINKNIRNFEEPVLIIETKKYRIRIDKLHNGKYRYTSWSINSEMSKKPDLIINNGIWIPEGNGGNHKYEFVNGKYKYECFINELKTTDTPPAELIIYKNNKKIIYEPGRIKERIN